MADAEDRQRWKMSSEQRKEKAFIEGNFKKCECDLIVRKSDSSVQQTDSSEGYMNTASRESLDRTL